VSEIDGPKGRRCAREQDTGTAESANSTACATISFQPRRHPVQRRQQYDDWMEVVAEKVRQVVEGCWPAVQDRPQMPDGLIEDAERSNALLPKCSDAARRHGVGPPDTRTSTESHAASRRVDRDHRLC